MSRLIDTIVTISIHALRGEGDTGSASNHTYDRVFQSTPSVGRATRTGCTIEALSRISIHALRGEGDP